MSLKQCLTVVFAAALTALPAGRASADHLSVTMGEVILNNLQPGATYDLTAMMKFPMKIAYEGKRRITVEVKPSKPSPEEKLQAGYVPIPDANWIHVDPSLFQMNGSSAVSTNVTITVPDDESLRGKKFVGYIVTQTAEQKKRGGLDIGPGAQGRLLISIATQKRAGGEPKKMSSYMSFRLEPQAVYATNVKPGRKIVLSQVAKKPLQVQNFGNENKQFTVERITGDSLGMTLSGARQWGPADTQMEVQPSSMKVRKGKSKDYDVSLTVPDVPSSYGKKFLYLVRVTPEGVGMSSGILLRINVDTASK